MNKSKIYAFWVVIFLLNAGVIQLRAQSAWGIQAGQTGLFGGAKYDLILLTARFENSPYQFIGISSPTNSGGLWSRMDNSEAVREPALLYTSVLFEDTNFGAQFLYFPYIAYTIFGDQSSTTAHGDQFSATRPPYDNIYYFPGPYGTNWYASGPAASALTNHSYFLSITDGNTPFASQGSVIFTPTSESNYVVFPTSVGNVETHGTYSYSITNAAAGCCTLSDSVSGNSTEYFGFSNAVSGFFMATQPSGGYEVGTFTVSNLVPTMFFMGQVDLTSNVDSLRFSNGTSFGYYDVMDFGFPCFYHFDLGFEWYFDASNSAHGCWLYDFSSQTFFYTDPQTFPYLYDFTLKTWLYYYPDLKRPGHYTSNPRLFYNFATRKIITK